MPAHRRLLPIITVSITRKASKANWSWLNTPSLRGRTTVPFCGSISPLSIFMKVDLPAPLGPVRPKRMETLLTESMIRSGSSLDLRDCGRFRRNGTQLESLEYHATPISRRTKEGARHKSFNAEYV